jgi:eukaryotic-like serine/threonine-protein kinase
VAITTSGTACRDGRAICPAPSAISFEPAGYCPSCGNPAVPGDLHCVGCGRSLGRFGLLGVIGQGATSTVYLALDRPTERRVALKVYDGSASGDDGVSRSRWEAEVARRLGHPCVVPVHELLDGGPFPVAVMEHVEGASLRQVLARVRRVAPGQVLDLVDGALQALAHVHRQGLVHGDVKPENVRIASSGASMLLDFGSASAAGARGRGGSPGYVSPEAAAGRPVDQRSDVFACGALLYECLVGGPPGRAVGAAGGSRSLPVWRRGTWRLRGAWRSVVASSLGADPSVRPQDAETLRRLVHAAARRSQRFARRVRVAFLAAAFFGLAAGLAALVWRDVPVGAAVAGLLLVAVGGAVQELLGRRVLRRRSGTPR